VALALPRPRSSVHIEDLSGAQKSAVLLLSMGPEAAATITQSLSPAELENITLEIARLDRVPSEVVDAVIAEWQQMETAVHSVAEGGVDYARRILEQAVGPQKASSILKRIESQLRESAGFNHLRNADPQQLTNLVQNEHPQTIALLLAHLEPAQAAGVLADLPLELAGTVLYRIARMEKVLPEVLQVLEHSFGGDAVVNLARDLTAAGGLESVAAVLNLMSGTAEKELLENIGRQEPELSEAIKNLMFVFEDIQKLDDRAVQRLLRDVQTRDLALAMKGASEGLRQRVFSLLPQRAANALREEIDLLGPVRLRDVEHAQSEVVKMVRALEEAGEISIGGGKDDMVI
jgi:flagellar motor switch protein FliG